MIEAPLTFIVPSSGKPRVTMPADPARPTTRSGEYRSRIVAIADARSLAEPPTLDREGFARGGRQRGD